MTPKSTWTTRKKIGGVVAIVVASLVALAALDTIFAAAPINARVVDGATGQPLPDVHIVANWQLTGAGEGLSVSRHVMVMETTTDGEGRFHFPGWGPRLTVPSGPMRSAAPELLLFKSGYDILELRNRALIREVHLYTRSDHDGETIRMDQFKGEPAEYARRLSHFEVSLNSLLYNDECNWKAIPQFLLAYDVGRSIADQARGLKQWSWLQYANGSYGGHGCGDLVEFVMRHA